jgi:hypothetical protein
MNVHRGEASTDVFAQRGAATLHAAYALAAMVACGLWFAAMGQEEWIEFRVARAAAIGSVAALSLALGLALASLRMSWPWAGWICAALELAVAALWIQLTGTASSYLLALPALLVLAHRAIDGPRVGTGSWLLAVSLTIGTVVLEQSGALPYASVYVRSLPLASTPPFVWAGLVAVLLMQSAALVVGLLLSRAGSDASSRRAGAGAGRRAGQMLAGKYRLERLIGCGGMGEVYAARRIADRARVAVKVLRAHLAGDPVGFDRWRREVEALSRLASSRIAQVLDSGADATIPYIVMEILRGEDLSSCLKRQRRLPLDRVVAIIEQVAEALDAAASIGVVHRDVKPRNIFLVRARGASVDARLLDFGLCRLHDAALSLRATRTLALVGTPGYFAPEQVAEDFGEVGPKTDVFALGAVAYRALTGERAFPSREAAVAVYEVLNHNPPAARSIEPSLPEAVDLVLALALAKDPEDRYASAGELARDLRAASEGALPEGVAERAQKLLRERATAASTITSAA